MKLTQESIIRTVSDSQTQILRWIMNLYCPYGFEMDPTYSKGEFYKDGNIPQPVLKSDIDPPPGSGSDVLPFCCTNLPYDSNTIKSIIFDPPFLTNKGPSTSKEYDGPIGRITTRFGYYKYVSELWDMYRQSISEFYRLLSNGGVLVFKCQDLVTDHKQFLSHVTIINQASNIGFYPKDLFILLSKSAMIGYNHHKQQHARKYHSYFIVFIKTKPRVVYGN